MHEVTITIEPSEKYNVVIRGEPEFEDLPETEEEYIEQSEYHDAANSYLETVHKAPTSGDLVVAEEEGEYAVAECPDCSRSWSMEARGDMEAAKSDVESRVKAHLPCNHSSALSWDDFSVSEDPDLVKKMATYFDGMDPSEPTDLLRSKLRLVDCEVYANAQIAAQAELRDQ